MRFIELRGWAPFSRTELPLAFWKLIPPVTALVDVRHGPAEPSMPVNDLARIRSF